MRPVLIENPPQAPPGVACNPLSQSDFDQLVELLTARLPAVTGPGGDFSWVGACPCITFIGGPMSMGRLPGLLVLNGP